MSALRSAALAMLVACSVGCDGPTLIVGEFMEAPPVDANMGMVDDADAAGLEPDATTDADDAHMALHDAGPADEDGGFGVQFCDLAKPCKDPRLPFCLPVTLSGLGVCGQCRTDLDCESGERCVEMALFRCRRDEWHDPKQSQH